MKTGDNNLSRKYNWYVFPFMLLTLFFVQCAEEGEFNPSSPDVHVVVILDLNANPNRLPVGDQLSIISGKVIDQNAEPFSETEVTFSAQQGSISALDTTDSDGRFSAEYRSGNEPGIDTVSVNILGSTSHIYLTITGAPTSISLDADRLTGMADGMDTIRVTATLEGHFDAIVGIPVSFESTAGTFGGLNSITINTNEYGQANTLLTAPASATSQIAEVTASILYDTEEDTTETDTTGTSSLTSAGANSFKNIGKLPKICDANLSESQLITFIGVLVTVEASPALILGDGYATSEIRAYVKDVNRQAIPGAEVIFSATLGGIPLSAVTNNSGLARVDLTSAERPGERDLIIARYGPSLSDSVDVEYAAVVSDVILESQSIEIIADGLSSTLITATVVGGTGSPVENIEVYFGADIGSLEMEHGFTDVDGQITVELIAPSSIYDQQMVVWAAVNYDSPVAAPRITGNISSPTISSITKVERTARRVKDDDKSPQRITREIVSSEETVKLDLPQSSFNSVSNLNLSNETSLVLEQHTSRLTHSGFFSIDELISDTISVYARG
ncbi:MAG: Ig-like domain-containing protein, partial [Calditrichaeota bacterium]|nr:Ig-like domain-containing protein [Calditrichota bacterium]